MKNIKGRRIKDIEKYSNQWVALDETGTKIIVGDRDLKTCNGESY